MTAARTFAFDLLKGPLEGSNLIEASAGTGKTYAIAGIFLRLLLEKRLTVSQILVVTYTIAATEELKSRIRETIRKAIRAFEGGAGDEVFLDGIVRACPRKEEALRLLRSALRDFDEAPIFTIHGFCQRTLHENAFESMSLFDTELIADETVLREEIARDFWRLHFYEAPREFAAYALEKGCGPDYYLKLSGKAAPNPDVRIVPEAEPVALVALEPFREAAHRVKSAWPEAKEGVAEKLRDPALNKTQYRKGGAALIAAMDIYAASTTAFPLFDRFEKMTPEGLGKGTKTGKAAPEHPFFALCGNLQDSAGRLADEIEGQLLFLKGEIFRYMRRELAARKRRLNIQSFDDLLTGMRNALESSNGRALAGALRQRYRAALVDEFQDTDPVQYAIFQTVFEKGGCILFLIGDPKQAIYSFRGADLFAYMKASKNVAARYTLTNNWRSEPGLIQAVNAVFSRRPHPFLYEDITFEEAVAGDAGDRPLLTFSGKAEPPLQLWYVSAHRLEELSALTNKEAARNAIARAVASGIADLLTRGREKKALIGERPLEEGDIAVLVRTNEEARLMQETLRDLGVASVLHSMGNLFDTGEALELERLLAGISEPGSENLVRTALATSIMGVDGETLDGLSRNETAGEEWLSRFRDYYDLWERHGFIRMFRRLMAAEAVRTRLLSFTGGERRLTNILHLSEVLHRASVENGLGMAGLLKWLARRRDPGSPRLEEHQLRLESDARAVRIVTIHKSKGLEYPVVFCPFNWGGSAADDEEFTYHDKEDNWRAYLVLRADDPAKKAAAQMEILAENIRLLYVSLTRAKHRCCLVWGPLRDAGTSSLSCILHPADPVSGNVVEDAQRHFADIAESGMRQDLSDLVRRSDGTIRLSEMPAGASSDYAPREEDRPDLFFRSFSGTIRRNWKVASFSHLVSQRHAVEKTVLRDEPDRDAAVHEEREVPDKEVAGIFAFPRGARAGTFLHHLFEHLDFTAADDDVEKHVAAELRESGYDAQWREALRGMIRNVLAVPLEDGSGLSLQRITGGVRLNELAFYFPLKPLTREKMGSIFAGRGKDGPAAGYPERIGTLAFQPCRGFMKGYMDLVFRWNGRFYIADWKSNWLGSRAADYDGEALARAMSDHFYFLQYHLYSLALHRYLAARVPGYDYEKHFGGVFYIFLRGVDPSAGKDYGIYRDLPDKALIESLEDALLDF